MTLNVSAFIDETHSENFLLQYFLPSLPNAGLIHTSSSSAFWSLLRQSCHLSCGLPCFLQHLRFSDLVLFGNLSDIILSIRLYNYPTQQASLHISSHSYFILVLFTLSRTAILLIQLFSHTCNMFSTICKPCVHVAPSFISLM